MLTAPFVESGITGSLADRPAGIVVDLSQTEFLASAGIRALIHACTAAADKGVGFVVVADSPATSRPIQLLGLQDALHLHPGTDEALAALLPSA